MRYPFPKVFHLCAESHFQAFFKDNKRVENKLIRLYFRPALRDQGKVAFVASKKTGNSVVRNRCKRLMREVFRLNQHQIDFTQDYVAVAKAGHLFRNYVEVEYAFQQLFTRIQGTAFPGAETEKS